MARINDALSTPMAGGEYLWDITPFRQMIEARPVDDIVTDPGASAGGGVHGRPRMRWSLSGRATPQPATTGDLCYVLRSPDRQRRNAMRLDPDTDILGVVDVQPTFMPGGELPVAEGDAVVPVINRLLSRFRHAFATQDWHPPGHSSFASAHPGRAPFDVIEMPYGPQMLWPDHALQGSANAALHHDLDLRRVELIIRKGFDAGLDSYSTFFENDHRTPTGLDGWLRQRGFRRLFLAGLATDFCVAWSAEDAARLGYEVTVVEDACRGIGVPLGAGRTTMDAARENLEALGVAFQRSAELLS